MKARLDKETLHFLEALPDGAPEVATHKFVYVPALVLPDPAFNPATHKLGASVGAVVLDAGVPVRWEISREVLARTQAELDKKDIQDKVDQLNTMIAAVESGAETVAQRRQYLGVLGRAIVWLIRKVDGIL